MGEEKRGPLADTPVPTEAPSVPEDVVDDVLAALSGHVEAVFLAVDCRPLHGGVARCQRRPAGMTRFEEGSNELIRRRRLRLDPVKSPSACILLCLRTRRSIATPFAHELFHAAGLMLHTELHDRLTNQVAPSPAMKDSPLLQKMRSAVLDTLKVQEWTCQVVRFFVEADDGASPDPLPEMRTALVRWHTLQVWSSPPEGWTYSVVGYHSSLLSRKPGFESWYVRQHPFSRKDSMCPPSTKCALAGGRPSG